MYYKEGYLKYNTGCKYMNDSHTVDRKHSSASQYECEGYKFFPADSNISLP